MGYRKMNLDNLYEIYRRHHSGQKNTQISDACEVDRKTISKYLEKMDAFGLNRDAPLRTRDEFVGLCGGLIAERKPREANAENEMSLYREEINDLVKDEKEPVKAKTAYQIINDKYGLKASYSTFKRFFRKEFSAGQKKTPIRIEQPPGREGQMDYGKVGLLYDPEQKKNRTVNAFVGTLSCSRLPYIEYVFSQDQQSFCESFTYMFDFYGGVPDFVSIDNLKTGVIKPHLYDPEINRTFQELAEHYGTFINPCRVGTPTDKGKVERLVPIARELFRRLKAVHPEASLAELNKKALDWCRNEYGQKVHGTTGYKPAVVFDEIEKGKLRPLPETHFEITLWKQAKVHPDQFIQFEKKRYSLPPQYRGKQLWARKKGKMLGIFKDSALIREYPITGKNITYMESDFPEVLREMMNDSYAGNLLKQSAEYGDDAKELIKQVLGPRAFLHTRRARGMIEVLHENRNIPEFNNTCRRAKNHKIYTPKALESFFEQDKRHLEINYEVPRSAVGDAMLREPDFFFKEDT